MARKSNKTQMQMTPIMSLAVLTLFAMMIPIFSISNSNRQATTSNAQAPIATQTPEADHMHMEK